MKMCARQFATLGVVAVFVCACASALGQGIADRIRAAKSPIVRDVVVSPANFWQGSGDAVYIYLVDAATDQDALDLWCGVVYPPGSVTLPPGHVVMYKGGEPQPGGGHLGVSLV